jgi:hypothetical protein
MLSHATAHFTSQNGDGARQLTCMLPRLKWHLYISSISIDTTATQKMLARTAVTPTRSRSLQAKQLIGHMGQCVAPEISNETLRVI